MRIKKVSQTTPTQSQIVDGYSTSTTDGYSCNYVNELNTYSTDEIRVGTWINGKPIYRKVVEFGSFPSGGSKTVATGITNLSRVVFFTYTWYDSADGAYLTNARIDNATVMCKIQFKVNSNSLKIEGLGIDWSSRTSQGIAILEYTKTTD